MNTTIKNRGGARRFNATAIPSVAAPAVERPLLFLLGAVILTACASVRPAPVQVEATADPASAGAVLLACSGSADEFCHGFLEATASMVLARGEACPPPIYFEDVRRVVLERLRQVPPEESAVIGGADAISSTWPCTSPKSEFASLTFTTTAASAATRSPR